VSSSVRLARNNPRDVGVDFCGSGNRPKFARTYQIVRTPLLLVQLFEDVPVTESCSWMVGHTRCGTVLEGTFRRQVGGRHAGHETVGLNARCSPRMTCLLSQR
jgi:hypothetical protein